MPEALEVITEVADEAPREGQFVRFPDSPFELFQPYPPAGDQPTAIEQLVEGVRDGEVFQTLLGVTGSGKTFTMAPAPVPLPAIDPARRAMMIFTSGTTNKPKGVISTHATVASQVTTLLEAWA